MERNDASSRRSCSELPCFRRTRERWRVQTLDGCFIKLSMAFPGVLVHRLTWKELQPHESPKRTLQNLQDSEGGLGGPGGSLLPAYVFRFEPAAESPENESKCKTGTSNRQVCFSELD